MKILFIASAKNIHTTKWANAFANRGNEVHIAYCKNHSPNKEQINNSVKLHSLKFSIPFGYYLNAKELRKIYNTVLPDVVNVHYASGYGTLVRKSKIPKYILSVWGSDVYDYPQKSRFAYKNAIKNLNSAAFLASTSYVMADRTRKLLGDKSKKITITPFGVDLNIFKPTEGLRNENKMMIGTVKTLKKKYGITDSIKAFDKTLRYFKKENQDIADKLFYEIYGSGEQKDEIERLINDLGLSEKVFLKGYVENNKIPGIINSFDIFVATSILDSESFGVAAVEAMSCGVPVVVSDVDGFKEVCVDNEDRIYC